MLVAVGIFREVLGQSDKIRLAFQQGALPPVAVVWEFAFLAAAFTFAWFVTGSFIGSSARSSSSTHEASGLQLGAGILGFGAIAPILLLPTTLIAFGWDLEVLQDLFREGTRAYYAASFVIGAVSTSFYVWLFYRPKLLSKKLGKN
ncbi:MAG: hypothetical protein GY822_22160 [Deltaproteobacteria bacterium]|nr:hypothetical protein [Deltaproteobacteria bacterium]